MRVWADTSAQLLSPVDGAAKLGRLRPAQGREPAIKAEKVEVILRAALRDRRSRCGRRAGQAVSGRLPDSRRPGGDQRGRRHRAAQADLDVGRRDRLRPAPLRRSRPAHGEAAQSWSPRSPAACPAVGSLRLGPLWRCAAPSGRGQGRAPPCCVPGRPGRRVPAEAPLRRALHALSVTALEQVLGSCLEALRAEHLEAEGVGKPVGRVERDADRQRVLDLPG